MLTRLLAAVPAVLLVSLLAGCGGDDPDSAADPAEGESTPTSTATSAAGTGNCEYADTGSPAVDGIEPPPAEPTVSGEVAVTMATSVGDFGLTLDADRTPCTVGSFVSLAEQGYFDGTQCHRVTDWGVLQCGDPSGTGGGGPGYSFPDELTGDETYSTGTVAMANAGPDTNGSQFFLVYKDTELPPDYTVFGTMDDATVQTVVDVAADGSTPPSDGAPNTAVEISGVTVAE